MFDSSESGFNNGTNCIALRFFATGTFLYTIGDAENLGKSAVCRAIRKVYLALKQFLGGFVVFPSYLRPQVVKQNFFCHCRYIIIVNEDHATMIMPKSRTYSICSPGFPNVIGAIDCTHVPIKAPPGPNEGDFVNRKGFHSVNVQVNYYYDS